MDHSLPSMLKSLEQVFAGGPSWPFRTTSARTVWEALERLLDADPNLPLYGALSRAFQETRIPALEMTPEDFSTLGMAARWKAQTLSLSGQRKVAGRVTKHKAVLQPPKR